MSRSSLVGRFVLAATLSALVGAACSQNGAPQQSTAGSVGTAAPATTQGPTATQGPRATPTAPGLVAPVAPANLTANDVTLSNAGPCPAEDPPEGCLSLKWTPPTGQVDGYRVYLGSVGGAYVGGPGPSGWYVCPENGSLAKQYATIPGDKSSYNLPYVGEHGPSCVALSAYNAAGESPWDIVMVGTDEEAPPIAVPMTYEGDGFSVDFPEKGYDTTTLASSLADGYEYMASSASVAVGTETSPRLVFAAEKITFVGKAPPDSGPDLVAFFAKTLAYYQPYSIADPSISDLAAVTLGGHAGFSFTLTKGGSIEKGEVFLIGGKVLGIVAGGTEGSSNLAGVSAFLKSFRIN